MLLLWKGFDFLLQRSFSRGLRGGPSWEAGPGYGTMRLGPQNEVHETPERNAGYLVLPDLLSHGAYQWKLTAGIYFCLIFKDILINIHIY